MKVLLSMVLALALSGIAGACNGVTEKQWVRSRFAVCVRWQESRDGAASRNIYEIQGPLASGNYGDYEWLYGVPRARQDMIAYRMWCARGVQPWRPYDGC